MPSKLIWIVSFFCLFNISCSSTTRTPNFGYSIESMHQAVQKFIPGKITGRSSNGRVYYSSGFKLPRGYRTLTKGYATKRHLPEIGNAKIEIMGITRPYHIEIEVHIEYLEPGFYGRKPRYSHQGRHKDYEKYLATQISDYLVKRHEKRNLIDDFRPF